MRIGSVEVPDAPILAPMAGVTDLPFRVLCREQGAGLVCMEMVSAKAISFGNRNTKELLNIDEREHPVSLQLFGSEPELMGSVAAQIEDLPFDILDVNMGCPVPKVVKNGEGSALMRDPKRAGQIVRALVSSVKKPVTVKIRSGFDEDHINAVEIARIAEDAGASAVTVHARTREQYYSGKADWDLIRQVSEAVSIPVIGSGDVVSPETAKQMLEQTGCAQVMIGRAARGNPWIFGRVAEYLRTGTDPGRPSQEEILQMILRHTRMLTAYKGEHTGVCEMRKHVAWYTAGLPGSSKLRRQVNEADTADGLTELLTKAFQ